MVHPHIAFRWHISSLLNTLASPGSSLYKRSCVLWLYFPASRILVFPRATFSLRNTVKDVTMTVGLRQTTSDETTCTIQAATHDMHRLHCTSQKTTVVTSLRYTMRGNRDLMMQKPFVAFVEAKQASLCH